MKFPPSSSFFFFNDTATTEIYTLSLHDALPISRPGFCGGAQAGPRKSGSSLHTPGTGTPIRSEEHTFELQSHLNLVCRLLLEKKKYNHRDAEARHVQLRLFLSLSALR